MRHLTNRRGRSNSVRHLVSQSSASIRLQQGTQTLHGQKHKENKQALHVFIFQPRAQRWWTCNAVQQSQKTASRVHPYTSSLTSRLVNSALFMRVHNSTRACHILLQVRDYLRTYRGSVGTSIQFGEHRFFQWHRGRSILHMYVGHQLGS
jgi:hypothetical protein